MNYCEERHQSAAYAPLTDVKKHLGDSGENPPKERSSVRYQPLFTSITSTVLATLSKDGLDSCHTKQRSEFRAPTHGTQLSIDKYLNSPSEKYLTKE